MKVKDPHFILERAEKYINEDIRKSRVRQSITLDNWKYNEKDMDERINDAFTNDYDDSSWSEFHLWETWGGYDKVAWFRKKVTVPESMKGKTLAFRFVPGPRDGGGSTAEGMVYIDEKPYQAIDIWHEEVLLDEETCRKDELPVALKIWSGVLNIPRVRTFKVAELMELDMKVDKFCFVVDVVRRSALLLDDNDLRRIKLTKLLQKTFTYIDFLNYLSESYYESVYKALDYIQGELDQFAEIEEIKPLVHGVGHSHIDMAWLWRLCATREKASRTFATVLNLMRQYPEYKFMHSSPQLYKFLKEDYPEIFEQVKEKIREGQWEITGGMWVESDTNVPSGESLVRQFLYGKRYIRDEFQKETKLLWLPDVFGYSAALPQIMVKSGMKYFMTTKISWNQFNHFPYDTFWWKGIDGTKVFTHFITTPSDGTWFYTYNGHMDPEEVSGIWDNYKNKDKNDELLIAYGWGDGGGGPTREMLENGRVMKNLPGMPKVTMTGAEEYFETIYNKTDHEDLDDWSGELYFEMHRGTYTSQAANKRYNRLSETMLHNLETLSVMNYLENGGTYPKEALDTMWERVLLNQFHDILPGSSIRQVYEDTTVDYEKILKDGGKLIRDTLDEIGEKMGLKEDAILLVNTLSFDRDDMVLIPYSDKIHTNTLLEAEGKEVSVSPVEEGLMVYVKGIPAYGKVVLTIKQEEAKEEGSDSYFEVNGEEITTPFWILKLNEQGNIDSLYDKVNQRKVDDGEHPMNLLSAFEDKPLRYDAWDVDLFYKEKPYERFVLNSREIKNEGERLVVSQSFTFNNSTLNQDMILYAKEERIDFKTVVDWKEKQVFLKAYFPVNIFAQEATFEIQFGNLKRPTHTNTEWDFAKFEVPGHKWMDFSEGGYGVALLNDCKYGYDVRDNVMGLSLIKSAINPDETADRKVHHFTYSLYPHAGGFEEAKVQEKAMMLNVPVLTGEIFGNGENAVKAESLASLVQVHSDHVLLDTIKMAEDETAKGGAIILRLYEFQNKKDNKVSMTLNLPISRVCTCNLCEEEEEVYTNVDGQTVSFEISNYEVKTFKVYLAED